jgi:uncharacterized OsmC-like protein
MKTESVIEKAAELKRIMARETKLARQKRSSKAIYRASVSLTKNLTVEARARDFTFFIDEPASFGGADKGPNPEEAVLAAVGACQAITAALYAAFLEIPIKRYEIALKGYADLAGFYGVGEKPTGFDRVVCEVTFESDAPTEKLQEFERLVEERCVGHGTLRQPVAVETHWTINNLRLR